MMNFKFSRLALCEKPQISTCLHAQITSRIICGLRNGPRKPLWRKHVLSTEAIQVVQSLKLAQNSSKLEHVFSTKVSRLLKDDLLDVFAELQMQNELDLALKVFNFVRNEVWYAPDLSLFNHMIVTLGKNKMIEMAERLFVELRDEGLEPDTRTFTEMIGAYFKVDKVNKAMDAYELMKASGCEPDKLTLTILIRNLEKAGAGTLSAAIKKECAKYFDYPEKFIQEVERTYITKTKVNCLCMKISRCFDGCMLYMELCSHKQAAGYNNCKVD